ncbi:General secretion pathway protein E [Candidatus Magnetomoraceae bacterium gMMP-15]
MDIKINNIEKQQIKTFGQLLVEKRFITQIQLKDALMKQNNLNNILEKQKNRKEKFIGQILIDMGIPQKVIIEALNFYHKRKLIGEVLVESKYITNEQLEQALKKQKKIRKPLAQTLIEMGYISYDSYINVLSKHFNMPTISLQGLKTSMQLQKSIGKNFALKHKIVVFENNEEEIKIAIAEPSTDLVENLYRFLPRHKSITLYLTGIDEIENQFKKIYPNYKSQSFLIKQLTGEDSDEIPFDETEFESEDFSIEDAKSVEEDVHSLEMEGGSAVAVKYANKLIIDSYKAGASDIHLEPTRPGIPAEVRMRVDGLCKEIFKIPSKYINAVISRIKIISGMNIADRRRPQDGKAKVRFQGKEIELRVATLPTVNGESVVIRILASGGALPFDKLNLSQRNYKETKRLTSKPHGLFLVVGPTGSGKTTTLHSILGEINTLEKKIWTAEDPVEITQPRLQQVQINHKIGLDFSSVMRAFLRADPDVILIGEMRDSETANTAIECSLTGHLVFSTLHTNSASETIIRLLDLGLDPFNFADALLGILAQRLVRTLCPYCKKPYKPSDDEFEHLVNIYGAHFSELGILKDQALIYKATGCEKCAYTGYCGRTGIHELLVRSKSMTKVIAANEQADKIRKLAIAEGMRTLFQDGVSKIFNGYIDLAQLYQATAE